MNDDSFDLFSVKSHNTKTNLIKPKSIINIVLMNKDLKQKWNNEKEFIVLNILNKNSVINGPAYWCWFLNVNGVNDKFIEHYTSNSKKYGQNWVYDNSIYGCFIKENYSYGFSNIPTIMEIRYVLESILVKKSKNGELNFSNLYYDIYKYFSIITLSSFKNGVPIWEISKNNKMPVYLRSKNDRIRISDKLGIQPR